MLTSEAQIDSAHFISLNALDGMLEHFFRELLSKVTLALGALEVFISRQFTLTDLHICT